MVPVRETAGRGGDGTENLSKVHRYPLSRGLVKHKETEKGGRAQS